MLYLLLLIVILLPAVWIYAEATNRIVLRRVFGALCVVLAMAVASLIGLLEQLNYNAWYGHAAEALIDASIRQLELGNTSTVIEEWKLIQSKLSVTYENKGNFNELANQAADNLSKEPNQ